ncbi:TPA: hypothetical protein ACH3X1_010784 [Trebouxia sp. C0004]
MPTLMRTLPKTGTSEPSRKTTLLDVSGCCTLMPTLLANPSLMNCSSAPESIRTLQDTPATAQSNCIVSLFVPNAFTATFATATPCQTMTFSNDQHLSALQCMQMYDEDPFGITSQVVLQAHVADGCSGAKNPSLLHSTAKVAGSTVQEVQEAVEECVADFIELYKQGGAYESRDLEMVTDYVEAIKAFAAMPKPEAFGLHENADITCDQNETNNLFSNILALQPRVSGGFGGQPGRHQSTPLTASDPLAQLLQIAAPFDVEQLQQQYPATYQESMNTVLVHEAMQYNALLEVVAASLKECAKAVKGLVFTSPSLEVVSDNMYDNQSSSAIIHPFLFKRYKHPSIDGKTNTYLLVPPILPRLMLIPMLMKSLFMSAASNRTRD